MHSAIVVVQMPADDHSDRQRWGNFSANSAVAEKNGATKLGENVWLIDFRQHPAALGRLIQACEQFGLQYGILALPDAPQWSPESFDPKTIAGQTA